MVGAPGLVAQTCPGNADLGTTAARLIPAGQPAQAVPATAGRSAGRGIPPRILAIRAEQDLVVPAPQVQTAPPRGDDGHVGLPEWFWITNWTALSKTAAAGAAWANVTASPQLTVINPGDGTGSFTCDGPGIPYGGGSGASGCTHLYTFPSVGQSGLAFPVAVAVTWTATWQGSGGSGGILPPLTRTTTFPLRIAEDQSLIPGTEGN